MNIEYAIEELLVLKVGRGWR